MREGRQKINSKRKEEVRRREMSIVNAASTLVSTFVSFGFVSFRFADWFVEALRRAPSLRTSIIAA